MRSQACMDRLCNDALVNDLFAEEGEIGIQNGNHDDGGEKPATQIQCWRSSPRMRFKTPPFDLVR